MRMADAMLRLRRWSAVALVACATLAGSSAALIGAKGSGGVCSAFNASEVATYTYRTRGADWPDNRAWQCNGTRQSPVEYPLPAGDLYTSVPASQSVLLGSPSVAAAGMLNLPQWEVEMQGAFDGGGLAVPVCNGTDVGCLSSPGAAPRLVNVTIANVHFHTPSEHTLDGEHFAMESHLVTTLAQKDVPACPAAGCIAVFGAFYRLGGADSGFLAQLTPYVNTSGVDCQALPAGKRILLAPSFPANRTYVTYSGSLTTPPCTEGVLWTSFLAPLRMSSKQLQVIQTAMSAVPDCSRTPQGQGCWGSGSLSNNRVLQDLNGRRLRLFSPAAETLAS